MDKQALLRDFREVFAWFLALFGIKPRRDFREEWNQALYGMRAGLLRETDVPRMTALLIDWQRDDGEDFRAYFGDYQDILGLSNSFVVDAIFSATADTRVLEWAVREFLFHLEDHLTKLGHPDRWNRARYMASAVRKWLDQMPQEMPAEEQELRVAEKEIERFRKMYDQ